MPTICKLIKRLNKAQLSKIIQSNRFLCYLLVKLAGQLIKVSVSLTSLATMVSASAIDCAIKRKIYGRGVVRAGKVITLVNI